MHEEDAALPVDAAVGAVDQVVGGVMRVLGAEALQQDGADVGLVVAVGVREMVEVGARGDDHPLPPELEPERVVDGGEDGPLVGLPVVVGVLQDHQAVVHRLERLPLGVGAPAGHPEPPLGVHLQLHGVGQFGELLLGGEHAQLESLGNLDFGPALLGREIHDLCVGARFAATDVRLHGHRGRHVAVVDRGGLAGHRRPDRGVAIGRHDVEHLELVPEHVGVALAIHEPEPGAAAPDVVAVGGPEAVVPVPVLVGHRGIHPGEVGVGRDRRAQQRPGDDVGEPAVARVVQVAAVDREPLGAGGEERRGRRVEIDEGRPGLGGRPPRGLGREGEVGVVGDAVGQVGVARVLEGDRTEEHEPRLRTLLGPQRAVAHDRLDELVFVGLHLARPVIRLVVAIEHEDDIGIDEFEVGRVADGASAAGTLHDRVAGDGQIAKPDVEAAELLLEHRLHPGGVLHPVGQSVAVDGDDIPLLERERGGGGVGRAGDGPEGHQQAKPGQEPRRGSDMS